jgi:hypothetical protein
VGIYWGSGGRKEVQLWGFIGVAVEERKFIGYV